MSEEIKLFKFSDIPEKLNDVCVKEQTENGIKFTVYCDEKKAQSAYKSDEIREKIKRWVLSENLVVLTGAGTSITTGQKGVLLDENGVKYTGKSVWTIWESCKKKLGDKAVKLQEELDESDEVFQLERFISKLEVYIEANSRSKNKDVQSIVNDCKTAREVIISTLREECNLSLANIAPHPKFLRDIMAARHSKPRMQLYTLNYDTLFEQAAERLSATVIDGFSFARNPVFNGANFDLDVVKREKNRVKHNENYEEKVFHLYKLHGSLDWRKDPESNKVARVQDISDVDEPVFIPPSFNKYQQSYDMPYFEMMARFQQSLRMENTTLFVIGYSFNDSHINRVIHEALNSNLNFELVVISPKICSESDSEMVSELQKQIENGQNNITLISDTFQRFVIQVPSMISDDKELQMFGDTQNDDGDTGDEMETKNEIPF